jgi:hypothetical protein
VGLFSKRYANNKWNAKHAKINVAPEGFTECLPILSSFCALRLDFWVKLKMIFIQIFQLLSGLVDRPGHGRYFGFEASIFMIKC